MQLCRRLLLFLQLGIVYGTPTATYQQQFGPNVPQYMTGEVPAKNQSYQIVRIIEYLVPYPYKRQAMLQPRQAAKSAETGAVNSLEIIPADMEQLFAFEPPPTASSSTKKPKTTKHFLLNVRLKNMDICPGALISTRLVLTSAHCFAGREKQSPTQYRVSASKSRVYNVANVLYGTESEISKELALLLLKRPVRDEQVQPVALCSIELQRQHNVTMYMSRGGLSFLRTTIIANSACKRSYAQDDAAFITEDMFCAQNTNKLRDCRTRIGDMLLHGEQLCGINIYGPHCVEGAVNGDLYANLFRARPYLQRLIKRYNKL